MSTRLDIHEHQKLSKKNHDYLLRILKETEEYSAEQCRRVGNTIASEAAATREMIYVMASRVLELETQVSRFIQNECSTSVRIKRGKLNIRVMYRSRPDFAVHTKSSSPQRQLLVAANRSRGKSNVGLSC